MKCDSTKMLKIRRYVLCLTLPYNWVIHLSVDLGWVWAENEWMNELTECVKGIGKTLIRTNTYKLNECLRSCLPAFAT